MVATATVTSDTLSVLIVDDSVAMRSILRGAFEKIPGVHVSGVAENGRVALSMIRDIKPDLVTLDIEMPEMDGLETLKEIRKQHDKLPVIMCSSHTQRGATITVEALLAGANDYIAKPRGANAVANLLEELKTKLRPITKLNNSPTRGQRSPVSTSRRAFYLAPRIVLVGASTGGPIALEQLLSSMPNGLSVPLAITQHMPSTFTKALADSLTRRTSWQVREVTQGERLDPGKAYVAPGGQHLTLRTEKSAIFAALTDSPPENGCRPAVDCLFRSAAETIGPRTLAVVLTGMGQDGLRGAQSLHALGAQIFVQDQATSAVWGMPRVIAEKGIAELILPITELGNAISKSIQRT